MADRISVTGPIDVQSDSKERVAYDLMIRVMQSESDVKRDREYFFKLFEQSLSIVQGGSATKVLKD